MLVPMDVSDTVMAVPSSFIVRSTLEKELATNHQPHTPRSCCRSQAIPRYCKIQLSGENVCNENGKFSLFNEESGLYVHPLLLMPGSNFNLVPKYIFCFLKMWTDRCWFDVIQRKLKFSPARRLHPQRTTIDRDHIYICS
jgi:hypothetical protein